MHGWIRTARRLAALASAGSIAGALFLGAAAPVVAGSIPVVPGTISVGVGGHPPSYPVTLTVPPTGVAGSYGWVVAHSMAGPVVVRTTTPWICGLTSSGMIGAYLVRYYAPGYCVVQAHPWTGWGYGPPVATASIFVYARWY